MKIKFSAAAILTQLKDLIYKINQDDLKRPLEVFSGSSIGQHTRHILEFYICLLQQMKDENICYDKRNRDTKLETEKKYIIEKIDETVSHINHLKDDLPLTLSTELSGCIHLTPSSISRELLYLIEHAVHHMAMIKIGIVLNFPSMELGDDFGVAASTRRYIEKNN